MYRLIEDRKSNVILESILSSCRLTPRVQSQLQGRRHQTKRIVDFQAQLHFSDEKNEVEKYEVINMGYHISREFRPVKWQPQVSSLPGLFSQLPLRSPRTLPFSVPGIIANLTSASDSPCSLDVLPPYSWILSPGQWPLYVITIHQGCKTMTHTPPPTR